MNSRFLIVTALAACTSIGAAQLSLPVTDNFPSGAPQLNWVDYDSPYSNIQAFSPTAPGGDGYVMNVNDDSYHQTIFLANDNGTLTDYKVTTYVYVPNNASTAWSRVGVGVRCQANNDFSPDGVFLLMDTDGNNYLRIAGRAANTLDWIEEQTETYTLDAWHKVEMRVAGTGLVALLDDVEIYNNPTCFSAPYAFTSGYIGLYNYINGSLAGGGSAALFDRVTIEAVASAVEDWQLF